MAINDIWAQLETDLTWRQDELRLLSNSMENLPSESHRVSARRAHLVMLYAHIEGFSKVALSTYIRALNDLGLTCGQVAEAIAVSSFADIFHAITYGDPKRKVFKNALPDDQGLLVFARRCEFMSQFTGFLSRPLVLPENAVDTESNLNSKVLRRNLYRLGFPVDLFASYEDDLNEIVYRRHSIAHGDDPGPVRGQLYEKLRKKAFEFMDELTLSIIDALETSGYRKKAAPEA
jgi:hypothetical protein